MVSLKDSYRLTPDYLWPCRNARFDRQRVVPPWPSPKQTAATHTLQPLSPPSAIDCYAADVYTAAMDPTISNDQERVFTLSIPPITVSVVVPPQQPGFYLRTAFQLSKFSRMEKCEVLYQSETQYAASVSHQSNELNVWSTERYLRPLARHNHIKISDCCRQGNYAPSSTVGEMTTESDIGRYRQNVQSTSHFSILENLES
ncbi:hypothetical protein BU17DRAFT_60727 [Hysterangium stoloniferum]|nr:hypothetical protein BU17DRAFT_60727 [Hysterangium stoloniferum]